ncbi:hypothetical protein LCGC14_3092580, partial [marine sediment metagenome]
MKNTKDITGLRIGQITALSSTGKLAVGNLSTIWTWKCDCGNVFERSKSHAVGSHKRGSLVRCSDCRGKIGFGRAARNAVVQQYKRSARRRDILWFLKDKLLDTLFSANCHYCNAVPSNELRGASYDGGFTYQGIDRINNELDYVPFNVV